MTIFLQRTVVTSSRTRLSSLALLCCKQRNIFLKKKKQQLDDVCVVVDDLRRTSFCCRWFASTTTTTTKGKNNNNNDDDGMLLLNEIHKTYIVHRRGDTGYGSREYLLCPPNITSIEEANEQNLIVAKLLAHRNMIFGARSLHDKYTLEQICVPLVDQALEDAGKDGEQPQAIASLRGLSNWVRDCLDGTNNAEEEESWILKNLQSKDYEAVQAIATGIPRKGHSVVGIGTYRDGEIGWKALAEEFVNKKLCDEANLYHNHGAKLVGIDHLADKNPDYLQSAGGAMARMFFIPQE